MEICLITVGINLAKLAVLCRKALVLYVVVCYQSLLNLALPLNYLTLFGFTCTP